MPSKPDDSESLPIDDVIADAVKGSASKLALAIGRLALNAGNYPGRKYIGAVQRRISAERGGVKFKAQRPDGTLLAAWFSPRLPDSEQRLPVVLSHGIFETKERHFDRAYRLNARGHDVVLFDHRLHGRSSGKRLTFGVEEKQDLKAVIDRAQHEQLLGDRVITMGFSLGGGTVLQHAAIDSRVAGVVALAPFADFRSAITSFRKTLTPWLDDEWLMAGLEEASGEAGFTIDEASALDALAHIDAPVLLVEAGCDSFLPPTHHTQKLAEAKSTGRLEVYRVEEANHVNLLRKPWPGLEDTICNFCASLD